MKRLWGRRGLGIFLFALFAVSLVLHYYFSQAAGETIEEFLAEVFANWQSEAWQVFVTVIATSLLYWIGSPQSKDGDERLERRVDEILTMLKVDEVMRDPGRFGAKPGNEQ